MKIETFKKIKSFIAIAVFILAAILFINIIASVTYADEVEEFDEPVTFTIYNATKVEDEIIVDEESIYFTKTLEKGLSFTYNKPFDIGYNLEFHRYDKTTQTVDNEIVYTNNLGYNVENDEYYIVIKTPIKYRIKYYQNKDSLSQPIGETIYTIEDCDNPISLLTEDDVNIDSLNNMKFIGWKDVQTDNIVTSIIPTQSTLRDYMLYMEIQTTYSFRITDEHNSPLEQKNGYTLQQILDYADNMFAEPGSRYSLTIDYARLVPLTKTSISNKNPGDIIDVYLYKDNKWNINYVNAKDWDIIDSAYYYSYGQENYLPQPRRTGYIFDGWICDTLGVTSPVKDLIIPSNVYGNLTIELVSTPIDYYISYDINYDEADPITTKKLVHYGEKVGELKVPSGRTGYTFSHWMYKNKIIDANTTFDQTEDITLLAVWQAISVIATFDIGYETENLNSIYLHYNMEMPLYKPTRTGYTFEGWIAEGDLYKQGDICNFTSNVNFVARWKAEKYIVTIYSGKDYSYNTQIEVTYDAMVDFQSSLYAKNLLVGFYTEENGKGEMIANYSGIINKWQYPSNLNVYTYNLLNIGEWVTEAANVENLPSNYEFSVNDEIITGKIRFYKIGNYKVILKLNGEIIGENDFTIECPLGTNNEIYTSKPITFDNINADSIVVDGKMLYTKTSRIDKHGKHTIVIYGEGDYVREYTVYYNNVNIKTGIYDIIGGVILFIIALILTILGRRRLTDYANSTINRK